MFENVEDLRLFSPRPIHSLWDFSHSFSHVTSRRSSASNLDEYDDYYYMILVVSKLKAEIIQNRLFPTRGQKLNINERGRK